jgi:DNA polymerase V
MEIIGIPLADPPPLKLPFFISAVSAGFPSPAEDYINKRIDLNDLIVKHPSFTFYIKVSGHSMFPIISDGDWIVVDRKIEPAPGAIVVALIDNDFCVKYFRPQQDGSILLEAANKKYKDINLVDGSDFEIWGTVVSTIRLFPAP